MGQPRTALPLEWLRDRERNVSVSASPESILGLSLTHILTLKGIREILRCAILHLWISTACRYHTNDSSKETEQLTAGKYKLLDPYLFAELGTAGGSTWNGNMDLLVCTVSLCASETGGKSTWAHFNAISLLPACHFSYTINPKCLYVFLRLNES